MAPDVIMKQLILGLFLALTAAAGLNAQSDEPALRAQVHYLQQVDVAIREGRLTQAGQMIALLEQSVSSTFADDLRLLKAEFHIAHMDVASASMALSNIENRERNICRIDSAMGWVAANQQAFDDAIVALARATKNCSDDAGAWNLLGLAFLGKGETMAARDAFGEAMLLEPDNAQLMNNDALAALQDGALDTALHALNRAAEKSPLNRAISANRNFVSGIAGFAPVREKGESDADWSAKLLLYAQGAKSASRKLQATALFSRAILMLDRFDEAVWSEVKPAIGGSTK